MAAGRSRGRRNSTYRLRALPGAIEDLEQVSQATDLLDPLREQVNWGASYLWDRETALAQATVRDMRHLHRVAERVDARGMWAWEYKSMLGF